MSLSNAERQRLFIARLKARGAEPGKIDALRKELAQVKVELTAARARIAELERERGSVPAVTNKRVSAVTNEARGSDDHLQHLLAEMHIRLERNDWNRTDKIPEQVALGDLLRQAQAHIRKGAGPRPASTSIGKKKAWQKRVDQQWSNWLDACGKLPSGGRVLMSEQRVRFLMRAKAAG